jgi:hypothetical protein
MLIFPLKKELYEKIKSGEKTVKYLEVKPYWQTRLYNTIKFLKEGKIRNCFLQWGYNPERRLRAKITKVEIVDGKDTDLHIDKPVYAIHLTDVREVKE